MFLELLSDPNVWLTLFTLSSLEIVLGIDNLVFISIIGVDRIPYGYHHAKYAAEQTLRTQGLEDTDESRDAWNAHTHVTEAMLDVRLAQLVCVERVGTAAVVDHDHPAKRVGPGRLPDDARRRRLDRHTAAGRQVDALVASRTPVSLRTT